MPANDVTIRIVARDAASSVIGRVGGSFKFLGAIAGITGTVAIGQKFVGAVSNAIKVSAEFESQISRVAAVSRATGDQLSVLSNQSKELGRTTVFTAGQAAEAQATLARAGFAVNEIFSTLPGTLDLAAAGELGLADAASISSNILRSFGLEASRSTDIADLLAKTANTSNTTVYELGEAFRYAGAGAKILGVDVEETSAAMAILADRGITASVAGAALSKGFATFLGDLEEGQEGLGKVADQLFDTNGKFIGLAEALRVMREAGIDSSQAFDIFGVRAGKALGILLDLGPEALEATRAGLADRVGYAADVAAVKLNNLSGDVTLAKSAMDGLRLTVGQEVTPALRVLVRTFTELITVMTESEDETNAMGSSLRDLVELITEGFSRTVYFINLVRIGFNVLTLGLRGAGAAISTIFATMIEQFREVVSAFNVAGIYDPLIEQLDGVSKAARETALALEIGALEDRRQLDELVETTRELEARFAAVPDAIEELNKKQEELAQAAQDAKDAEEDQATTKRSLIDATWEQVDATLALNQSLEDQIQAQLQLEERRKRNLEIVESIGETADKFADVEFPLLGIDDETIERERAALEILQAKQAALERQVALQQTATRVTQRFTGALVDNAAAAILNAQSAGEAIGNIVGAALDALAQEALVKAGEQIALAFAALGSYGASGNPGAHFASAAKWAAVAVVAKTAAGAVQRRQAGGIVTGLGGVDSQLLRATPGESVLSQGSTREILGGRAAVVPLGAEGAFEEDDRAVDFSALRGVVLSGDAMADWLEANARPLGIGIRRAQALGEI